MPFRSSSQAVAMRGTGGAEEQFGLLCLRCRDAKHAAQSGEKAGHEGQAPALLVVVAVLITS